MTIVVLALQEENLPLSATSCGQSMAFGYEKGSLPSRTSNSILFCSWQRESSMPSVLLARAVAI